MKYALINSLCMLMLLPGCSKPENGHDGGQGAPGVSGRDGAAGPVGPTGASGANVSAVKFCKTSVTVYPSSFPEYGLCIGNKIFANYWDGKNSWLAEIPPGYYNSTSTSAPCNFTVKVNCTVE